MKRKSKGLMFSILVVGMIAGLIYWKFKPRSPQETYREITPEMGSIETFISSTGTIQPQNRLEIKPPINGRIDQILVKEGEAVKTGQIIGWMSSTDRAALLDTARPQGGEVLKHWQEVYKPTPLIAPIDGEVIVSITQPGQIVTSTDAVVVLSDHLIVQAQVDETDIGKVALGQDSRITLDAYPDINIPGKVDHVYYESTLVNNVTIYKVDVIPAEVPPVFRSGMSANIDIIQENKQNILTIPLEAVIHGEKGGTFVLLSQGKGQKPERQKIKLGVSDDKNVEVVSGLSLEDKIVIVTQKYNVSRNSRTTRSPLMPTRRR